jgi:hypothetical protein
VFYLRERLLDGVKVRRVGGQENDAGCPLLDQLPHPGAFVDGEVVHHHDPAALQRRAQQLPQVEPEGLAIRQTLDAQGRTHALRGDGRDERTAARFPETVWKSLG